MEYVKDMISTVGFPIAVAAFLLVRIEKKLDQLNNTLISLMETFLKNNRVE